MIIAMIPFDSTTIIGAILSIFIMIYLISYAVIRVVEDNESEKSEKNERNKEK